jgi:hypothetical protein
VYVTLKDVFNSKYFIASVMDSEMGVQQWWNDTDRGKLKYWERNIIQRVWYMNE